MQNQGVQLVVYHGQDLPEQHPFIQSHGLDVNFSGHVI
jgi:methyl coenzyme M reductase subunit D